MAAGDIFVGGTFRPGGPFGITEDSQTIGGYRVVATLADRDAIPASMRKFGMIVFVQANGFAYKLNADLTTYIQTGADSVLSNTDYACAPTVAIGDIIYLSGVDTIAKASAFSLATMPSIGLVYAKPTTTSAVVIYEGELSVFTGLIPGTRYYASVVAGQIVPPGDVNFPSVTGNVLQDIGLARNSTTLVIEGTFATIVL
jgi:hypothetical protein